MCVHRDILAALAYFDVIDHPLTQTELYFFLRRKHAYPVFQKALRQLASECWIYRFDACYTLQDDYTLLLRRRQRQAQAWQLLKDAETTIRLLSAMPFVRGIAVAGPLSRNLNNDGEKLDLLLITAENRLWLCRTLLLFCTPLLWICGRLRGIRLQNFMDESGMESREKNLYGAMEIATLVPLSGTEVFERFYARNAWSRTYLPNHSLRISYIQEQKFPFIKKSVEFLLHNPVGNVLDHIFMKATAFWWSWKSTKNKKQLRSLPRYREAGKHFAKQDPEFFQKRIVQYERKVSNLFRSYESKVKTFF